MPRRKPISGVLGHTRRFPDFTVSQTSYVAGAQLLTHCHTEPILSFAIAGGTTVSVAGKEEWCDEGSLLYLPAGVPHANSYPCATVRVHIEVTPSFWKNISGSRATAASRVIRHPITRELRRSVASPLRNAHPTAEIEITTYLAELIAFIAAERKQKRELFPDQWLLRLRDFLDAHCTTQLGMQALVAVAGRHPVHISREFRRHFGSTITEFLRTRRVVRAAKLIAQRSQSLASIALECGFCDQSHLTNAFRRHTGIAPSRWRSLHP